MTRQFRKTVSIKAIDEENRTATGAVLVPDTLDHQHDFLRADAVERFHADDPKTGVMHSAFPGDAATLERNEVLDEPETIGDEEFAAGTWIASRRYEDDRLWQLVDDGVLTGFSIGGAIERAAEHDALPEDVRVPDDVEHDGDGGTELLAGTVEEVSDVDIPAVPAASYKGAELGKSLLEEVDGEAEFVELMVEQRGHDEADARRLYQYLTDVRESALSRRELLRIVKAGEGKPGDTFEECVEIIMEERGVSEEEARAICGALAEDENITMSDSSGDTASEEPDDGTKWQILKELVLGSDDADAAEAPDAAQGGGDESQNDASEGETSDDDMTDDDTEKSEAPPAWAADLNETVEQIDKRVSELEADDDDGEEKAAMDDAPAWAQDLAAKVDDLDERVDTISQQSGHSQQLDGGGTGADETDDEVKQFKSRLVGGRTGGD